MPRKTKITIEVNLKHLMKKQKNDKNPSIKIFPGFFIKKGEGDPYEEYELMNYLGEGGYGKVYKVKHKLTGQYRAMKIIKCKSSSKDHEKQIKKEIEILKSLDHPNILKVYEFFCNEKFIFFLSNY